MRHGNLLLALMTMALIAAPAAAQELAIDWHTIDGGGGISTGGSFSLHGTIGQTDTMVLSGASTTLDGGYWPGVSLDPGCNVADLVPPYGVLDFFDVAQFLAAFSSMQPEADLVVPFGVWDFFDVVAFLGEFSAGCP